MEQSILGVKIEDQYKGKLAVKAACGDMALDISPATVAGAATAAAWERTVTIKLQDAKGNVHSWFNAAIATSAAIADTSTAGTASIDSTTLTFVDGVAAVKVSGDAEAWLATETDTLTISNLTVMGYTVTGGTSVQTFA